MIKNQALRVVQEVFFRVQNKLQCWWPLWREDFFVDNIQLGERVVQFIKLFLSNVISTETYFLRLIAICVWLTNRSNI